MRKPTVEERRNEILEAACQVVIERGFGATRVADVANKLGVSTGLIHYHFESKDHLLSAALELAARNDTARLEALVDTADSMVEKLDVILSFSVPDHAEPTWMLWIDCWGEAMRNPTLKRISQELDRSWTAELEEVIREGVESGDFRCKDPRATAWRLTAVIDGFGVQITVHDDILSRTEMLDWVRAMACSELDLPADAFARLAV